MVHRLLVPSGNSLRPYIVLLLLLFSLTHCQKKDETPPPPNVQAPAAASPAAPVTSTCCQLSPATGLQEGMGRLIVAFPDGAVPKSTRVALLKDGKVVKAGFASQSWELLPGTYDVVISGKTVANVTVQCGHDTNVKVGVLRVTAAKATRSEVVDGGKVLAAGHGDHLVSRPARLRSRSRTRRKPSRSAREG